MDWVSTLRSVSMQRLAEQGEVGGLILRLMMVLQDYAFANRAMAALGSPAKKKKQGDTKRAAGRYFLRLQMSHSFEALEIIKEIKASEELTGITLGCDRDAKAAFNELEKFLDDDDYKLLARIRNNVGFHYDRKVVLKSLARVERRRQRQIGKHKQGSPDLRRAVDAVKLTLARKPEDSQFVPWELVENDIVLHDIFKLDESDTIAGDLKLDSDADRIVVRLHKVQHHFSIFAARFILKYAK